MLKLIVIIFIAVIQLSAQLTYTRRGSAVGPVTLYFSQSDGSDSDDGLTEGNAKQTITAFNALTSVAPGSSFLFKCGDTFTGNPTVPITGTAGNTVTIGRYGTCTGSNDPIISGAFTSTNRSYLLVEHLQITGAATCITLGQSGATVPTDIELRFLNVHDCTADGLFQWRSGSGVITNLSIHDSEFTDNADMGIRLTGSSIDAHVYDNEVIGNVTNALCEWCGAIKASGSLTEGLIIEGNTVGNTALGLGDISISGVGIWCDTCGTATDNIIRYNYVYKSNAAGIMVEDSGPVQVYYNRLEDNDGRPFGQAFAGARGIYIFRNVDGALVDNNSVTGSERGIELQGTSAGSPDTVNVKVRNNAVSGNVYEFYSNDVGAGNVLANNAFGAEANDFLVWEETPVDTYAAFDAAYGADSDSVPGDVLFVNEGTGDLHLQICSPARNAGLNLSLTADFDGTAVPQQQAVDIGAFESNYLLHSYVDAYMADANWITPASGQFDCQAVVSAIGGGGGGTTNVGGGGGGAGVRSVVPVVAATSYAVDVGAAGAAASAGANSTFGSTTVVAAGGSSGTTGAGGTTAASTGDLEYAGGAGANAAGTQGGGGGAGTAGAGGAGTGSVGGDPGQFFGGHGSHSNVVDIARFYGGGGRSTAAAQTAGAQGLVRVMWNQVVAAGFPRIVGRSWGRSDANTTSHAISLPACDVGDYLLVGWSLDLGGAALTVTGTTAGWTTLGQDNSTTTVRGAVFARVAVGSDALTITTSGADESTWFSYCVKGAAAAPEIAITNGDGTNSDPPSVTYSGGSTHALWFAFRMGDLSAAANPVTAGPPTWLGFQYLSPFGHNSGADISVAEKLSESDLQDPFPFTSSAEQWVAATVVFPGTAGTALQPPAPTFWQLFKEGTGTTPANQVSGASACTIGSGTAWENDPVDLRSWNVDMDGDNDTNVCGSAEDNRTTFSGSAWINPDTYGQGGVASILNKSTGTSTSWRFAISDTDDKLSIKCGTNTSAAGDVFISDTDAMDPYMATGAWTQVGFTCTGDASMGFTGQLYINGQPITTTRSGADATGTNVDDSGYSLYIGALQTQTVNTFDGGLDDIRFWGTTALSAAQMLNVYQEGRF